MHTSFGDACLFVFDETMFRVPNQEASSEIAS